MRCLFFFFKQKTAYEMRISDWSSDVCSSDLNVHDMVYDIMNDKQRKAWDEFLETDFSFEIPGLARFRVNAFSTSRGAAAVFRTIPSKILSLEDLKCPADRKSVV